MILFEKARGEELPMAGTERMPAIPGSQDSDPVRVPGNTDRRLIFRIPAA